jgi:phage gp36-like protein
VAYASIDELTHAAGGTERLTHLADWDGTGTVDGTVLDQALAQADAFLDQYLSLRYSVPISNPSPVLRGIAAEQAVYWLRQARDMVGEEENRQLENRQRQLELMRDGKLRPEDPTPAPSTAVVSAWVERSPDAGAITRHTLKGQW